MKISNANNLQREEKFLESVQQWEEKERKLKEDSLKEFISNQEKKISYVESQATLEEQLIRNYQQVFKANREMRLENIQKETERQHQNLQKKEEIQKMDEEYEKNAAIAQKVVDKKLWDKQKKLQKKNLLHQQMETQVMKILDLVDIFDDYQNTFHSKVPAPMERDLLGRFVDDFSYHSINENIDRVLENLMKRDRKVEEGVDETLMQSLKEEIDGNSETGQYLLKCSQEWSREQYNSAEEKKDLTEQQQNDILYFDGDGEVENLMSLFNQTINKSAEQENLMHQIKKYLSTEAANSLTTNTFFSSAVVRNLICRLQTLTETPLTPSLEETTESANESQGASENLTNQSSPVSGYIFDETKLRLCLSGSIGSGRHTLANALSQKFNLKIFDVNQILEDKILTYKRFTGDTKGTKLKKMDKKEAELPETAKDIETGKKLMEYSINASSIPDEVIVEIIFDEMRRCRLLSLEETAISESANYENAPAATSANPPAATSATNAAANTANVVASPNGMILINFPVTVSQFELLETRYCASNFDESEENASKVYLFEKMHQFFSFFDEKKLKRKKLMRGFFDAHIHLDCELETRLKRHEKQLFDEKDSFTLDGGIKNFLSSFIQSQFVRENPNEFILKDFPSFAAEMEEKETGEIRPRLVEILTTELSCEQVANTCSDIVDKILDEKIKIDIHQKKLKEQIEIEEREREERERRRLEEKNALPMNKERTETQVEREEGEERDNHATSSPLKMPSTEDIDECFRADKFAETEHKEVYENLTKRLDPIFDALVHQVSQAIFLMKSVILSETDYVANLEKEFLAILAQPLRSQSLLSAVSIDANAFGREYGEFAVSSCGKKELFQKIFDVEDKILREIDLRKNDALEKLHQNKNIVEKRLGEICHAYQILMKGFISVFQHQFLMVEESANMFAGSSALPSQTFFSPLSLPLLIFDADGKVNHFALPSQSPAAGDKKGAKKPSPSSPSSLPSPPLLRQWIGEGSGVLDSSNSLCELPESALYVFPWVTFFTNYLLESLPSPSLGNVAAAASANGANNANKKKGREPTKKNNFDDVHPDELLMVQSFVEKNLTETVKYDKFDVIKFLCQCELSLDIKKKIINATNRVLDYCHQICVLHDNSLLGLRSQIARTYHYQLTAVSQYFATVRKNIHQNIQPLIPSNISLQDFSVAVSPNQPLVASPSDQMDKNSFA